MSDFRRIADSAVGMACGVVIGMLIPVWSGHPRVKREGKRIVQQEAVEHGHADWIPQPDGSVHFRWREAR